MNEHHCDNPACPTDGVSADNARQSRFYSENDRTIPAMPTDEEA